MSEARLGRVAATPSAALARAAAVGPMSNWALVRGAIDDVTCVAQTELALAKLDLREGGGRIAAAVPALAAGAVGVGFGAASGFVGVVVLLDMLLPLWAALMIAGAAAALAGTAALARARRQLTAALGDGSSPARDALALPESGGE